LAPMGIFTRAQKNLEDGKNVPQRLARCGSVFYGTAEAVPFLKTEFSRRRFSP
jgi:hypothetical protein